MRRSRLGGLGTSEFPSSGEDSFVAVVVTKLTGALLFLLLLVMVIMALLPKAIDVASNDRDEALPVAEPLAITTPESLPEAIAGRPYAVALAARGAAGPLRWGLDGALPDGLAFDPESGVIQGVPKSGVAQPVELIVRVTDGSDRAIRATRLVVYQPDRPLSTPSKWMPGLPPIPWKAWFEQGFGFLVLLLIHMVGIQTLTGLERRDDFQENEPGPGRRRRFLVYRWVIRLATLSAMAGLGVWLWLQRVD